MLLPFIVGLLVSALLASLVIRESPPQNAGEWGSLLSALIALWALGAFSSTIMLQTEELALQRQEISNLAASAQDQGTSIRRQTTIESYRIIDEQIDALFSDQDFQFLINSAGKASNTTYLIRELHACAEEVTDLNFQGLHNVAKYAFITQYHHFPIFYFEDDGYGGRGPGHSALLPLKNFCILHLLDAAHIASHVYELSRDLELEDYARSIMGRRTNLESLLYVGSQYQLTGSLFNSSVYLSPAADLSALRDTISYHLDVQMKFYNPVTAALAGEDVLVDILSEEAEAPFQPSSLRVGRQSGI